MSLPFAPFALGAALAAQGLSQPAPDAATKALSGREVAAMDAATLRRIAAIKADPAAAEALLRDLSDRLAALEGRIQTLERQDGAGGKSSEIAKARSEKEKIGKLKVGGFASIQYQSSDRKDANQFDAFRVRRARLVLTGQLDPRASFKISEDLASSANNEQASLRDATFFYNLSRSPARDDLRVQAGQFPLFLGYELERPDFEREMPEKAIYNQTLFPGDRSRGVGVQARLTKNVVALAGVVNPLSIDDAEQANVTPGVGNRLAGLAAVRAGFHGGEVGVSYFGGSRPENGAKEDASRQFTYVDATYRGLFHGRLELRGEAAFGHDRLANASRSGDVAGFQAQSTFKLGAKDDLTFRWEGFDPNRSADGDAVSGYGLSWRHALSADIRLMLAHEAFVDGSRAALGQQRYGQTTVRLQYRF